MDDELRAYGTTNELQVVLANAESDTRILKIPDAITDTETLVTRATNLKAAIMGGDEVYNWGEFFYVNGTPVVDVQFDLVTVTRTNILLE